MTDQFKVVKIVSPYQVVINGGSEMGLRKGQRFLIYALGEMIKDPDSGEDLEQLELVKGTGKIVHLQSKIATIESDMTEETPRTIKRTSGLGSMRTIFGDTEVTELSREEKPFLEPQLGDLARLSGT